MVALTNSNQQDDFSTILANLEACVETPHVPGEMPHWIEAVADTLDRLQPLLFEQIRQLHLQHFEQICRENNGLIGRVEEMKRADVRLMEAVDCLHPEIDELKLTIDNVEPDEAQLEPAMEAFKLKMLDFVIRVRTQEQCIRTWLLEAIDRENGVGD